jgi:hypothetical protein
MASAEVKCRYGAAWVTPTWRAASVSEKARGPLVSTSDRATSKSALRRSPWW